ncbi:MAG: DUF1570 domain-containing protein [Pseudomonadales bacterium]|nr:DUF1570 domain-containing protein [Pseudomonadales bacterium]
MFRLIRIILLLVFLVILPLSVKLYYSTPLERVSYLAWVQERLDLPLSDSVKSVRKKIGLATTKKQTVNYSQSTEGFQPIANCGKTDTLPIEKESGKVYRWVDSQGQVHFSDAAPGELTGSQQPSVYFSNGKRYFKLKIIEQTTSLPAFTRDKVSADVRQIYGILSRDMALDHLRQVMLNIKIIGSQAAFQAYRAEVAPRIATNSGFYTSNKNEAVVFQAPNEQRMLAVVRHEATHVIIAGLYGYSPVWFNEGLAEYFEHMEITGQLRLIEPVAYHLTHLRRLLKGGQLMSLRDYVQLKPDQWYGGHLEDHYAQAWALVYFLMSEETGKRLLQEMMEQLAENYCWQFSTVDFIEQNYPGGFAVLEVNWRRWLARDPQSHRY